MLPQAKELQTTQRIFSHRESGDTVDPETLEKKETEKKTKVSTERRMIKVRIGRTL